MKKKGTKKPKPTAVSFDSKTWSSRPLSARRTIIPATKPPIRTSRPSLPASRTRPKTSTTVIRTASWLLASKVRSECRPAAPGEPHRDQGDGQGEEDEGDQDRRLVQGVVGREDEGDEQDRAELADPAGGQQVGAELRLQLAVVAQDRDQRPDRRRRHRRAGVEEGDDHAGCGEDAADPVGERRPRAASPRRPASAACP